MKNITKYLIVLVLIAVIIASVVISIKSSVVTVFDQTESPAKVGIIALKNVPNTASLGSIDAQEISWSSESYPRNTGVNINLIRKISDSPMTFELVRTLAQNTENDGSEIWVPTVEEKNSNLYIEVTCSNTENLSQACFVTSSPVKID
ncbi:MAG: hypothetical protein AAB895_02355 [Patescibacteria group bacterium]